MNLLEKNIREIAEEVAAQNNFFLTDIVFRGNINNRIIEIYVDGENSVSAEDCANLSRKINKLIEEKYLIESSYRLDISSPGVDRPLKFLKQYTKHVGRKFEVSYKINNDKKLLMGKLLSVNGDELVFSNNNENEMKINFSNIIKAKVIVSFS